MSCNTLPAAVLDPAAAATEALLRLVRTAVAVTAGYSEVAGAGACTRTEVLEGTPAEQEALVTTPTDILLVAEMVSLSFSMLGSSNELDSGP